LRRAPVTRGELQPRPWWPSDDGDGDGPLGPPDDVLHFCPYRRLGKRSARFSITVGNKIAVVGEPFALPLRATDKDQEAVALQWSPGPAGNGDGSRPAPVYGTADP